MTKALTEKYNDSCIKLFEFIKMLYNDDAEFKKVIALFSDGKYDGTSNTHVTLNKYLNALKIFGVNIKKINHKYKMQTPLYKIDFDKDDIKSINLLKKANQFLPNGTTKNNFEKFIQHLEIRLNENIPQNNSSIASEMVEQIKLCEKYCQEKYKLEITYIDENGDLVNLLCSPIETSYVKRKVLLKVLGANGSRIYEIPLESIKTIVQLPSSAESPSIPTTVLFRLKNRLAKNYQMRDWERLEKKESDGSLLIVNKNEDFDVLLRRLLKYGKECEIISPKFIKEEMINLINKTLSNYQ